MPEKLFTDFDAYAEAIQDADLRMMMPQMRLPRWEIGALPVGGIHIQHGVEGGGNLTEGAGRERASVVFLPAVGNHRANGAMLDDQSVLVIEPRSEFSIAVQEPHTWFSISIPHNNFRREQRDDAGRAVLGSRVVAPGVEIVARIRTLLDQIFEAALVEPNVLIAPATASRIESELTCACMSVFGQVQNRCEIGGRRLIPRDDIIKSAINLLEQSFDFTLSVDDLAGASDVLVRTLRNAFLEYFGIPPLRYLTIRRLHEVRRALRASVPEATTVTAIATRYGFWQFGRFAGEYLRLLGEPPSDTLKRRKLAN